MSGSTEFLVNNSTYRPSATSAIQRSNIINHFQQAPIKKSSSFNNRCVKTQEKEQSSAHRSNRESKNGDSRSTVRNHVQFVLPLNGTSRSNTPTKSDNNYFTNVLTPTNSNSSISNRFSEFKNFNVSSCDNTKSLSGLNRLSNTAPLKNLTSIRSSSFRNKNSVPNSTKTKYEPSQVSKAFHNGPSTTNNATDFTNKSRSCKSYESINQLKSSNNNNNETKFETEASKSIDPNTHNIHRLIKMATNWNSKNKGKSDSASGSASKSHYTMSDRSLISQTKIRKTQTFLNDENKMDSESSLSRKMAEVTDKSIKVSQPSIDEAFADAMSDKSVRVFNSNRTPQPIRILPMALNRLSEISKNNDTSCKKSVTSIIETNDFSNKGSNTYWSANSYGASEIGEMGIGSSAKESSISSYLSKNNKSISFMHLNKNLNSSYKTNSTSTQGLNRISQGLPIHT